MTEGVEENKESVEKTPRKVIIIGTGSFSSSITRTLLGETAVEVPFTGGVGFGRQGKGQRKANRKDRWG